MTTLYDRILAVVDYSGFTQNGFESACGLARGTISSINKGMRSDNIAKIAKRFPEINMTWLLTGEGKMVTKIPETDTMENAPLALLNSYLQLMNKMEEVQRKVEEQNHLINELTIAVRNMSGNA